MQGISGRQDQKFREKFVKDGKATWRVWVGALALAAVIVPVEHWAPGWSRPLGAAALAIGWTVISKRRYWAFSWFWVTLIVLIILQVPLTVLTKPWMDVFKYSLMWLIAFADLLIMGLVIELVASRLYPASE